MSDPLQGHPRYRTERQLDVGAFGNVVLAYNTHFPEKKVAIKLLKRGSKITTEVAREIVNHRKLTHTHVVQFLEVFLTDDYLAIVMEYAERGNLLTHVERSGGKLHEEDARWIFQQIIVALDYLHGAGVAHRDLKLENTLMTGKANHLPLVKLCDFGYSKHVDIHSFPNSKVGTLFYMAPEVLMKPSYDGKAADMWSCGVMLFTMLVGRYPFEAPKDVRVNHSTWQQQVMKRILNCEYCIPESAGISPECCSVIRGLLTADPNKRMSMQQLLTHPWFIKQLPAGALEDNETALQITNVRDQAVEDVAAIVEQARFKPLPVTQRGKQEIVWGEAQSKQKSTFPFLV